MKKFTKWGINPKNRIFVFLLLLVGAFGTMAFAPMQEGELPDFTNLEAVLTWVVGFGAPYLVGIAFSYLAENFQAWHKLPKEVKFFIPMVVSVLIAIGAQYLLAQPAVIAQLAPVYTTVAQAIIFWLGSQNGYMNAKASGYAAKAKGE